MLGEKHQAIANWLIHEWSSVGFRVCAIEGFSGVGKTEVASEFERQVPIDARVDAPESGELDDLMLSLSEQLAAKGHLELMTAINEGMSVEAAFEAILLKPVYIVVDEFQRLIDTGTAAPITRVAALIERVSKRSAPGRLLLLSHRGLDKTRRWGERVTFKTLTGLSPDEGAELLGQLLASRGRELDIPFDRRPEISRWLGGNPRAIRVLVGCLEQEALDDLTGVVPEAWEARDQEVAESLIATLERELLVRALESLDGSSASTLEGLAVFREAITRDGITRLLSPGLPLDQFLAALSSRFLIEQRAGWYSLNPVVREISFHRLKGNRQAAGAAHRAAASYYTRHFAAKQIVNAGALGGAYVEARYHLVQSDGLVELSEIAHRFGKHLRSVYGWVTPAARGGGRRDEIIGVLSAYLQTEGPKAMEYHLARLLYLRQRPGDHQRALEHVRRSCGPQSPTDAWVLRLRLEVTGGVEPMMKVARQAISTVPADANLFAIYLAAADQLALTNRIPEAISLIEEGIANIPPERGLHSLYLAEADLLAGIGQLDEAILLLRQGLTTIPAQNNVAWLYTRAAELLITKDRTGDAVVLLKEGILRIPPSNFLHRLYVVLAKTLVDTDRKEDAVSVLREGLRRIPTGSSRNTLQEEMKRILETDATAMRSDAIMTTTTGTPITSDVATERRVNILAVATEWESRHGGLSTFNRDLCIELAVAGHQVVCLVPQATSQECESAKRAGVRLVSPTADLGLEGTERLLLDTPLPYDFDPNLIIGHDRKTGPHAKVLAQRFRKAKFILFVHTRPEDIEWHKDRLGPDDAATTAEERSRLQRQLASASDLVVGVGPTLAMSARSLVYLASPQPVVHRLDPGFRAASRPVDVPPEIQCLLLGRAEDCELKGLDIAARAMGAVTKRNKLTTAPRLVVRGAPIGSGMRLREQLVALGDGKLMVDVHDYSPDVERLQEDILMASLILMPSRSEGFGLVALEAIAANTPVLVSDRSGIAALLSERFGNDARGMIVETRDDLNWSAQEWERSIEAVLLDRAAAFARAQTLRERLGSILNWRDAIRRLEAAWTPLLAGS